MTLEEIKLRQLTNQHLIAPGDTLTVVGDLCGIQAQFMASALHSLKIRVSDHDEAFIKASLVKNWALRGTVHVFAKEDLPLFIRCNNGADYRRNVWDTPSYWNQREDWALTPQRQQYLSDVILQTLAEGPCERDALKAACRNAGMTEAEEGSMFYPWGGGIRELCERGFMHYTVEERKAFCLSPAFTPMPEEAAKLEIARRYFTNYGPATIHDAMYFLGATQAQVKKWLAQLPVETAQAASRTYYYIESGKTYGGDIPPCLFLGGFDQLMLGYQKKESLYLAPEHLRGIFNLAGIVLPAILLHGQVVGKWKRKGRKVTAELFTHVKKKDIALMKRKAEELWADMASFEVVR